MPELEKVTQGLRVSEERLRQMDTYQKEQELLSLLNTKERTKIKMLRALTIANELVDAALGMTERGLSLLHLGQARFYLQQYEEAHESWVTAMKYAEQVHKEFGDSGLLYNLTSYLLISYTVRKEYTSIQQTLDVVEGAFANDPMKMGYANYARMKWQEHRGDIAKAKEYAYLALGYFQQTNDQAQIGKAMINVGHFEYHTRNYEAAKDVLASAVEVLDSYEYPKLFAVKDYVKTLLKLDEFELAGHLLEKYSPLAKDYPDLQAKLQILFSILKHDPSYAKAVSEDVSLDITLRYSACKYLMEYYTLKRDSESLMHYYEKGNSLLKKSGMLIDEEGF